VLAVMYQEQTSSINDRTAVKLWGIATGKELDGRPAPWFDDEVMAFGPDGKTIAAPTDEGTIVFRDAATGRVRGEFHGPRGRVTALAFGLDGRLFTGSLDATVLAWDPRAADGPPADRN
jgi:WD40 repeat protein